MVADALICNIHIGVEEVTRGWLKDNVDYEPFARPAQINCFALQAALRTLPTNLHGT